MLSRIGIALIALALAGCGRAPGNPTSAVPAPAGPQREIWEKPGAAFRAEWTWSSSGPGAAAVTVTVAPKKPGESLRIHAKLPKGVALTGGDTDCSAAPVAARAPVTMSFQIAFAPDSSPVVPVEIALILPEGRRSAATLAVCDPTAPRPKHGDEPVTTDAAGFPGRIAGEMEPARNK